MLTHGPEALADRSIRKPLSSDELSFQETSIWLHETASAFVLDGAFTVGPPTAAAANSGASGLSASQATMDRMRLKHAKQMPRDTRIRPPEGAVAGGVTLRLTDGRRDVAQVLMIDYSLTVGLSRRRVSGLGHRGLGENDLALACGAVEQGGAHPQHLLARAEAHLY